MDKMHLRLLKHGKCHPQKYVNNADSKLDRDLRLIPPQINASLNNL